MGYESLTVRCMKCSAPTPHTRKTPNHAIHLLLSLFTAGLWLIAWLLVAMSSEKPKCQACGVYNRV